MREILRRHKGSQTRLAGELGVSTTSVWQVLAGRTTSERIFAAAQALAVEYLASEQSEKAA